jgi:hypothetical protein
MNIPSLLNSFFQRLTLNVERSTPTTRVGFERGFAVTPNLVSDDHWQTISGRKHDRTWSEIQEQYTDSLTAWRKNPMAWRVISTTVNYVVGKGIELTSKNPDMNLFIQDFWQHRKNKMDLRLVPMCEELSRPRPVCAPNQKLTRGMFIAS